MEQRNHYLLAYNLTLESLVTFLVTFVILVPLSQLQLPKVTVDDHVTPNELSDATGGEGNEELR